MDKHHEMDLVRHNVRQEYAKVADASNEGACCGEVSSCCGVSDDAAINTLISTRLGYSEDDLKKMERIKLFRSAGLSLDSIGSILKTQSSDLSSTLESRLFAINDEIDKLRGQQSVILKILENEILEKKTRVITKDVWVSILMAAGLDEPGMKNWHVDFESSSPDGHQEFLESIGINKNEIAAIRDWSRAKT